jgi:hypothetical protein
LLKKEENFYCLLCKVNIADKLNSHIISKFLGKRLFEETNPRHSLVIEPSGKSYKIQDTFKEDNILCSNCEKRIEKIETLISREFEKISSYENYPKEFELKIIGTQEYIECTTLNPNIVAIFIYTIIWRISISKLYAFQNFKLDNKTEKQIGNFLDKQLSLSTTKLKINSISNILSDKHFICLMKAKEKTEFTRGVQTSLKLSESIYHIYLNEFFLVFYSNEKGLEISHKNFSIIQNEKLLIPVADSISWQNLMTVVFDKTLNRN